MDKLYQLLNRNLAPRENPFMRVWIKNKQSILIEGTSIKFIVLDADTRTAFKLKVVMTNNKTKKVTELNLVPEDYLDLTTLGFFVAIRAAEWTKEFLPVRFLAEIISLNKTTTLSVCK